MLVAQTGTPQWKSFTGDGRKERLFPRGKEVQRMRVLCLFLPPGFCWSSSLPPPLQLCTLTPFPSVTALFKWYLLHEAFLHLPAGSCLFPPSDSHCILPGLLTRHLRRPSLCSICVYRNTGLQITGMVLIVSYPLLNPPELWAQGLTAVYGMNQWETYNDSQSRW